MEPSVDGLPGPDIYLLEEVNLNRECRSFWGSGRLKQKGRGVGAG